MYLQILVCTKNGIRFGQGQTISVPGQCMQVTCENAANNRQSGIICAYTQPRRGCRLSSTNYHLPYPQCCPVERNTVVIMISTQVLLIALSTLVLTDGACVKNGVTFQQGQTISVPGLCMQVTCTHPLTNTQEGIICSYKKPRPGCYMSSIDYNSPFPHCCPQEICKS
ncbi:hypothetical protein FQR65_LT01425 [Abscondita terminalis]|nr:hypothetical protein FQR65_LT01425 [Abscondita terminalis]